MKRIIDIHSHILPGVDDGCKTREEAMQMLDICADQDVEAIICTPHHGPCGKPGADVQGEFDWLREKSGIDLHLGSEAFVWGPMQEIESARKLAGSSWTLIEFDNYYYYTTAQEILSDCFYLAATGHNVILAHPERYMSLQLNPGVYKEIAQYARLQINAYSICEDKDPLVSDAAKYLLRKELVSYIGSDTHGHRRKPRLKTGVQWIYDHCRPEYADAIVHDNAEKLIKEGT